MRLEGAGHLHSRIAAVAIVKVVVRGPATDVVVWLLLLLLLDRHVALLQARVGVRWVSMHRAANWSIGCGHARRLMVAVSVVVALVLTVQFLLRSDGAKGEVRKATADLGYDTASAGCIANASIALSARTPGLRGNQMRTHSLDQLNGLRMCGDGQSSLHNVVAERIHHQLTNAFRVAYLLHVHCFDSVIAALKALLHNVGAEFLDRKEIDLPDDALANSVNVAVRTDVKDILNDIVAIGILHELQRLFNDAMHQMSSCFAERRVQAALDHTASVTVTSHITDTRSNRVKDKLGMLVAELEQDTLNDMIAMAIDAKTSSSRGK